MKKLFHSIKQNPAIIKQEKGKSPKASASDNFGLLHRVIAPFPLFGRGGFRRSLSGGLGQSFLDLGGTLNHPTDIFGLHFGDHRLVHSELNQAGALRLGAAGLLANALDRAGARILIQCAASTHETPPNLTVG